MSEQTSTKETASKHTTQFSPKVIAVILIAALIVVLSGLWIFRSFLSGNVLDSIESGSFRFDLCGDKTLAEIKIYENGKKTASLKISSIGTEEDHYGVTVTDLNFDGYPDLLIARSVSETDLSHYPAFDSYQNVEKTAKRCDAWLWNAATGTLRHAETLSGIVNPVLDEEFGCIVSQKNERKEVGMDTEETYYEASTVYSVFCAVNGEPVEFARYELTYYTKNNAYSCIVYRYDTEVGRLVDTYEDIWMDADEASVFPFYEIVRMDMEAHRSEYPNAKPSSATSAAPEE